ncbi:hypothetical protein G6F52_003392 [Rhizopus delemar]|nr:hypothetical protein G6F52_003392 [Rhizopus delemar]
MFLCRRISFNRITNTKYLTTRLSSSSCGNDAKDSKSRSKEQEEKTAKSIDKVSFMPVINIPEKELAHNAFFSLHRPLLGLSSTNKRPFFSTTSVEEQQEAEMDELLIQYMSTVEHFVGPPPPGSSEELNVMNLENYEEILEKNEMLKENERSFDIETQEILPSSLPIFRMPESGDIIDFLSTMEIHLPQSHLTKKNISKRSLPILETHKNEDLLACTSKTSFNVALDNVLFVSTLEGCWTRSLPTPIAMKRQVSLSYPKEREIIFHSIPRRHSHPEPSFPLSLVDDSRRLSTEPVRRISSESTTATSSVSSLEDIEKAYDESKMIQDDHHSYNICETIQEEIPIWADPVKMKENPTRYEHVIHHLNQANIPFDSPLPLSKPCTFYFTDSNHQHQDYLASVKPIFDCDTVWNFTCRWRLYKQNYITLSQLMPGQNIFCFVQGVGPVWEDPVNKRGGRLNIQVSQIKLLDELFETVLLAFIGGSLFAFGVVGVVVSKRYRGDRIEIWLDESATENEIIELK